MEIDFKLSKAQQQLMDSFAEKMGEDCSWVLQRFQGTGLKYWRITWSDESDWQGVETYSEGKTLQDTIDLVLAHKGVR